jgi:RHS repeat-associated protein
VTLAAGADWRYLHTEHLGSVVAMTNASGAVMAQMSYDAFGKRRNADGTEAATVTASPYGLLPPIKGDDGGYTGHEMLDSIGLIHMNGRIYDPVIGRFISADPFIQAPGFTLSYNRYAYVGNNPLVLTDPSGYWWLDDLVFQTTRNLSLLHGDFLLYNANRRWGMQVQTNPYVRMVGIAVACYFTGGLASAYFGTTIAGGIVGGAVGGYLSSQGDLNATAQGALMGGLFAYAGTFGGTGEIGANSAARYAAHAAVGCVGGAVSGAGCGRGAAAAVVGKFASNLTYNANPVVGFAVATVAGGTASVITGGKFASGAKTAAFGYLFNAALTMFVERLSTSTTTTLSRYTLVRDGEVVSEGYGVEPAGATGEEGESRVKPGRYGVRIVNSPNFGPNTPSIEDPVAEGSDRKMSVVRIHAGNTYDDTDGCYLPGTNVNGESVSNSRVALNAIRRYMTAPDVTSINIQYINPPKSR